MGDKARAWRSMCKDRKEVVQRLKDGLPEPDSNVAEKTFNGTQAKLRVALESLAQRVQADDSLRDGIPSVLLKEPSARGEYDLVVLREFEAAVDRQIAKLWDGLPERVRALEAAEHLFDRAVKPAVVAVQLEQSRRTALREKTLKDKEALASFLKEKYEPLRDHKFENAQERKGLLLTLSRMVKKFSLNLDEGFQTSLPMVLKRLPEERTAFEQALLKQAEESWEQQKQLLDTHVERLDKDLGDCCAGAEATATDETWAEEQALLKEQQEALSALRKAEEEKQEAEKTLEARQAASETYRIESAKAGETHAAAQEGLTQLQSARGSLAALQSTGASVLSPPAMC